MAFPKPLDKSLCELEFDIRTYHALERAGFRTIRDLLSVTDHWPVSGLRAIPGIGANSASHAATVVSEELARALNPVA